MFLSGRHRSAGAEIAITDNAAPDQTEIFKHVWADWS